MTPMLQRCELGTGTHAEVDDASLVLVTGDHYHEVRIVLNPPALHGLLTFLMTSPVVRSIVRDLAKEHHHA